MSKEPSIKIYEPRHRESLVGMLSEIAKGFAEGRELAWRLFLRDLKAGYKRSLLGIFWLFLPPIATAVIWIFLNSQNVVKIQGTPMAYPAFTMCGTMIWSLFAEAITKPMLRYQEAMGMMGKLNFPRESLILASIYDLGFSLLLKLIILIPVLWGLGYPPGGGFLLAIPVIAGLMLFGISIGLVMSPVGLLYGDIGKALPIILPFAMYLTPVIYPLRQSGKALGLQLMNPVTPFLEQARSLIGGYSFHHPSALTGWLVLTLFFWLIGLLVMRIALPIIVERSGS